MTYRNEPLKPCPFCGGDAVLKKQRYAGTGASGMETPWPYIMCNKCKLAQMPLYCDDWAKGPRSKRRHLNYKEAEAQQVAAWNTRPDQIAESANCSLPREVVEEIARIIDPSSWRVMDSYLAKTKRKYAGQNVGWPEDQFQHKESMAIARLVIAKLKEALNNADIR